MARQLTELEAEVVDMLEEISRQADEALANYWGALEAIDEAEGGMLAAIAEDEDRELAGLLVGESPAKPVPEPSNAQSPQALTCRELASNIRKP